MALDAIGGLVSSNSANKAAKTEAKAAQHAADLQMAQFEQTQTEEAPYIQSGNAALQALMQGLGFTQSPAGTGAANGATSPGPSAQQQIDWIKANITKAAGHSKAAPRIEKYLAAHPNQSPEETLAGLQGAFHGGSATEAYNTWLNAQKSAVTGTGGWQYNGTGGALNKPFDPSMLENTPGYKFTLNQGLDAINNNASAHGGIQGGNTLKSITDYAEGLAGTTYQQQLQDYMAQQQQQFGQLDTLVAGGQNAVGNLGTLGAGAATNAGNALIGAGNATAAGQIATGNAITGGLANFQQQLLSAISGGAGGGGGNTLQALFGGGSV